MFHDPAAYPFVERLEQSWRTIQREMTALGDTHFMPWPEKSIYGEAGWRTFGLYAFGQKQRRGCELCPETARLVRRIPGMTMAGFSRLAPGAHITPHRGYEGYSGYVLRCHLGLAVPPGCTLRVGDETRQWQEGRCLVFDDSYEHEAWNRGEGVRTVLLIDFRNPKRRWPLILNPQLTPEMVDFIENDHVPTQRFHQKLAWRAWRLVNRR
jgi:aspartyl/asparaginyl beta-hydroxylase (cupin superfamily)